MHTLDLSQALKTAVVGVLSDAQHAVGPRTQALGLFVIARLAARYSILSPSFSLFSSYDAAEDFLEKLSCLRVTCASADPSASKLLFPFSVQWSQAETETMVLIDVTAIVVRKHWGLVR